MPWWIWLGLALFAVWMIRATFGGSVHLAAYEEFKKRLAEEVAPEFEPAVMLRKLEGDGPSYIGGRPPAHPRFEWPRHEGRPLTFMASLDLAGFGAIGWLPPEGRLLFFYDLKDQPWGCGPEERARFAVRYLAASTAFEGEAEEPAGMKSEWRLPRRTVEPEVLRLPPADTTVLEQLEKQGIDVDDGMEALFELTEEIYGPAPQHQVGGPPSAVQDPDMGQDCVRLQAKLDPDARKGDPAEWKLLLQFDTDDDLGIMWGDAGRMYFWVREEDARRADFDQVWAVGQCH